MSKEGLNKKNSIKISYIDTDELSNVLNNGFSLSNNKKIKMGKIKTLGAALVMSLALFQNPCVVNQVDDDSSIVSVTNMGIDGVECGVSANEIVDEVVEPIRTKEDILNDYTLCDSLEKIYQRQVELEGLGLTDSDKIYKDCALSAPLQHFIYEQSIMNGKPFDFLLSIIYVESRGNFNSSGQVGCNGEGNWDLGLTQQNSISSLPNFQNHYGVSDFGEAYQLLRDNDYVNVCAAFLTCKEIDKQFDSFDAYEYAGCYNGWLKWRDYETSLEYVDIFHEGYDSVFTQHHTIEKEKTISNNQLVKIK